jgi:hypothetical protein
MKVTVTTDNYTFSLEVPEDLEVENFKAFCEVESVSFEFRGILKLFLINMIIKRAYLQARL